MNLNFILILLCFFVFIYDTIVYFYLGYKHELIKKELEEIKKEFDNL